MPATVDNVLVRFQPRLPAAGGRAGGDVSARAQGVPAVRHGLQQPAARRARQPAPAPHRRAEGTTYIHHIFYNNHYKYQ